MQLLSEIEARVYQIVELVKNGKKVEDNRVELKGEWIDGKRTARLVAGHANDMRGESILWVFGIDEKRGVIGVNPDEFSNWWSQFKSQFNEGVYPEVRHVNVPVGMETVVALR